MGWWRDKAHVDVPGGGEESQDGVQQMYAASSIQPSADQLPCAMLSGHPLLGNMVIKTLRKQVQIFSNLTKQVQMFSNLTKEVQMFSKIIIKQKAQEMFL